VSLLLTSTFIRNGEVADRYIAAAIRALRARAVENESVIVHLLVIWVDCVAGGSEGKERGPGRNPEINNIFCGEKCV